jgi:hypothetical protein
MELAVGKPVEWNLSWHHFLSEYAGNLGRLDMG